MRAVEIRPIWESDIPLLEYWKSLFPVLLDTPNGYSGPATSTYMAQDMRTGKPLCSLTGTMAIVLDPLLKDGNASPLDLMTGVLLLARHLDCLGIESGAVESYLAVPDSLPEFQDIVERCGYIETAQGCKIYRRSLRTPSDKGLYGIKEEEEKANNESDNQGSVGMG